MSMSDDALGLLDDYLSCALSEERADEFEGVLFTAAASRAAPELAHLDALFSHAAWLVPRGGFMSGTTAQVIRHLRALPRVHYIDVLPDTRPEAWPEDTELVVYRLAVDLRGYERVDVEVSDAAGKHLKWFRDCVFDPSDGALYGVCDAPLARSTFRMEPIVARIEASRIGTGAREIVTELRVTPQ